MCVLWTHQAVCGACVCLQGGQGRSKYTKQSLPNLARVKSHWSAEEGKRWQINRGRNALINTGISSNLDYKYWFLIQPVFSLLIQISFPAVSSYLWKTAQKYCDALRGCCLHHPKIWESTMRHPWGWNKSSGIPILHIIKWILSYPWNLTQHNLNGNFIWSNAVPCRKNSSWWSWCRI